MNPVYRLILRSGSRDSVYLALWLTLGEKPGRLRSVGFSKLVALCARYGAELTEPQLRGRFKSLVDAGLVEKVDLPECGAQKRGIAEGCQARCRALEIRAALRELQKLAAATACAKNDERTKRQ